MKTLTLKEVRAITGMSYDDVKNRRRKDQVAGAFGLRTLLDSDQYVPIDCVALMLRDEISKAFGGTEAAQLIRMYGDTLARIVADAEEFPNTSAAWVSVICFQWLSDGKEAPTLVPFSVIESTSTGTPDFDAAWSKSINVAYIIRRVRENAKKHGIDLSEKFMPAPGSNELEELLEPYGEHGPGIVFGARARKQREAIERRAGEEVRASIRYPVNTVEECKRRIDQAYDTDARRADVARRFARKKAIDVLFEQFVRNVLPPGSVVEGAHRAELWEIMGRAYDKVICNLGTGKAERQQ
jgi:hypothetical protein